MLKSLPEARDCRPMDCPDGFDVPGLGVLLDARAMAGIINGLLPASRAAFVACEVVNLRYKTPSSCLVTYKLVRPGPDGLGDEETHVYARGFSQREFELAAPKIGTTRWVDSADGPSVIPLPQVSAILYWFPNDERLHGLRRITMNKKLQRVFYQQLSDYPADEWRISDRSIRLQVIRYKPERRAVIRCRFRAHRHADGLRLERFVYLGVYEDGRDRYLWNMLRVLHRESARGGWRAPSPLAWISEHGALVCDTLEGVPLREIIASANEARELDAPLRAAAAALVRLHAVPLRSVPAYSLVQALRRIEETRGMIARFAPESAHDTNRLAAKLSDSLRGLGMETGSFVHGDLHPRQILVDGDSIGFLDFDRAHIGDPVHDLGNFRAQLWMSSDVNSSTSAEHLAQSFIEHYQATRGRPVSDKAVNIWTSVSLFHSALRPIGRAEAGWRARLLSIISLADSTLK